MSEFYKLRNAIIFAVIIIVLKMVFKNIASFLAHSFGTRSWADSLLGQYPRRCESARSGTAPGPTEFLVQLDQAFFRWGGFRSDSG